MTLPEQQTICTRPFEWFEIHPDGGVFLCCPAWLKRPAGNLLRQPVAEIWNGPLAREIRKSILNGSFHSCSRQRCPHLRNATGPVQSLGAVKDKAVREAIAWQRSCLDYAPRHLNLCYDLSCNLACPSCRTGPAHLSVQDLGRISEIQAIIETDLLPQARGLTLSGYGDPFASPSYFRLLGKLSPRTFPNLGTLRLHSNGQLFTPEAWEGLPGIHGLLKEVEISLDGATEETYLHNRPGADFRRVLENLRFIQTLPIRRVLSMVVQQNNWREIPQFLNLARTFAAEAYLSRLVNWGTFSAAEYRRRAVHLPDHQEYQAFKELLGSLSGREGIDFGNLTSPEN